MRSVVFCDCGSPEHHLVFDADIFGDKVYGLNVYYRIQKMSFWERFKLLFGESRDGIYGDVIIDDLDKLKDLRNFINELVALKLNYDSEK